MNKPTFSIILPVYNVSNYLERCVNSIQYQSFTDYEVIFVDDGSTDDSGKKCDEYVKRFKNAIVIHKKNGGLSSARNAGLDKANGKYVFMIDSDDWIETQALQIIYNETIKNPDIIKFNYIRRPNGKIDNSMLEPNEYSEKEIKDNIIHLALEKTGKYILSAWSHVYKMDFLNANNLRFISEREIGSEDYLFNFQALVYAGKLNVISDALYNYDCRDGSLTQKYRKNLPKQYDRLHYLIWETIEKNNMEEKMKSSFAYSYIEKMIGVSIENECRKTLDHTLFQGWLNTQKMIRSEMFYKMIKLYPKSKVTKSRRIILFTMKIGMAIPIMYLLIKK